MKLLIIGVLFSLVAVIAMFIIPTLATHASKGRMNDLGSLQATKSKVFLDNSRKPLSAAVGVVGPYLQVIAGSANIDISSNTVSNQYRDTFPSVGLGGIKILNGGKWYYELELLQTYNTGGGFAGAIGWVDDDFKVSDPKTYGVGDDEHSFAYDLSRRGTYNGIEDTFKHYGPKIYDYQWKIGDRIGCYLDMDTRKIEFRINGIEWGTAFENFKISGAIYPAVSFCSKQKFQFHFITSDWMYTPEDGGYKSVLEAAVYEALVAGPGKGYKSVLEAESEKDKCGRFTPNNGELGHCRKCVNGEGNDRLFGGTYNCAYVKDSGKDVCVRRNTEQHTKGKIDIAIDDEGCDVYFNDGLIRYKGEDYLIDETIPDEYNDQILGTDLMTNPVYFKPTKRMREKVGGKVDQEDVFTESTYEDTAPRFDHETIEKVWVDKGKWYNPFTREITSEDNFVIDDKLRDEIKEWLKNHAKLYSGHPLSSAPGHEEEEEDIDVPSSVEGLQHPPPSVSGHEEEE